MKVNQAQTQKTNPINNKSGMETFLNPSSLNPSPNPQSPAQETKPKSPIDEEKERIETKPKSLNIDEEIERIEAKLANIKTLDLSEFNKIVFEKQLKFKLLFIRARIYLNVSNGKKNTIIAINAPRWGGSSLRYLMTNCANSWCVVVEKASAKGKILSYKSLLDNNNNNVDDIIFD